MAIDMETLANKLANSKRLTDRVFQSEKNIPHESTDSGKQNISAGYDTLEISGAENQSVSQNNFYTKELKGYVPHSSSKDDTRLNEILAERNVDPFDNHFMVHSVEYGFQEGSVGAYINNALKGKVTNSSLIASDLVSKIQGSFYNKNAMVEERALNREIAIKSAEHIAANCFDNPDEAKKFLDEIKRFAENDVWREKDYYVDDFSDLKPCPNFMNPVELALPTVSVSYSAIAKSRGVDLDSMSTEERNVYEKEIESNYKDWSKQFLSAFNKNANEVGSIIDKLKNSVKKGDYNELIQKSLERISKAF